MVSQLQAALHPAAVAAAVPPMLEPPLGLPGSTVPRLPTSSGGGGMGSGEWQPAELPFPALPSSSIGSDYQWGGSLPATSTIDLSVETASPADLAAPPGRSYSPSSSNSSRLPPPVPAVAAAVAAGPSSTTYGSRASADLLNVLMPLLASASNFAAVSGVAFVMADAVGGGQTSSLPALAGRPTPLAPAAGSLPAAEVAVGPGKLKRMLSQLIDGIIACAARGDLVQASVLPQSWQGRPGVAVTLCCCYSLTHGSGAGSAGPLPRPPLQPEFAFLRGSAAEAGGWFDAHAEPPDVRHGSSSSLAATLWLPTVVRDAGW